MSLEKSNEASDNKDLNSLPSSDSNDLVDVDNNINGTTALNSSFANSLIGGDAISEHFTRMSDNNVDDEEKNLAIRDAADSTSIKTVKKHGFFSPHIAEVRTKIVFIFLRNWLVISTFMLLVFSIYWGAIYNRTNNYYKLKFMIVNEDVQVGDLPPLVGNSVVDFGVSPLIKPYGTYEIYNAANFTEKYQNMHGATNSDGSFNITEAIRILIHHQHIWGVVHIQPNTTYSLFNALRQGDSSYNVTDAAPVNFYYETARDFLSMTSIVVPNIEVFQFEFTPGYVTETIMNPLINLLTSDEKFNLISKASNVISNVPSITGIDFIPVTNYTLFAPMQVGMIYLIIITFFNFNFFASVHQLIVQHLKISHFMLYRIISAQISYFILSLPMSLVSLAFQVDFTVTFGKSGFLVFWMTNFLTMSAVGGANENMAMLIFPIFPPLLGFWLLSWVVLNISTAFFTFATMDKFYRYGYLFPLHNSYQIMSVILTNSYKGTLGRNYGVLVAWVVINILASPLCMKFFASRKAKAAAAERKLAEQKKQ